MGVHISELLLKTRFQGQLCPVIPSPQPDAWVLLKLSLSHEGHI